MAAHVLSDAALRVLQDLTMDDQVDQRLKNNPKVRVEGDMYAYQVR